MYLGDTVVRLWVSSASFPLGPALLIRLGPRYAVTTCISSLFHITSSYPSARRATSTFELRKRVSRISLERDLSNHIPLLFPHSKLQYCNHTTGAFGSAGVISKEAANQRYGTANKRDEDGMNLARKVISWY